MIYDEEGKEKSVTFIAPDGVAVQSKPGTRYVITLLGSFRMETDDGSRIEIASKKTMALIAMLAMSKNGEHSRSWLQMQLWGSRQLAQAQSSLRRELSMLRTCLKGIGPTIISSNRQWVALDLGRCRVDARTLAAADAPAGMAGREFLEGFEIPGESGFAAWLEDQRRHFKNGSATAAPIALRPFRGPGTRAEVAARHMPILLPQQEAEQAPTAIEDSPTNSADSGSLRSLAVMQVLNCTDDADVGQLAETLNEDMVGLLSRLRWLSVMARSFRFPLASEGANPAQLGRQLGASYILESRLRRADGVLNLSVNLMDAEAGLALWSDRSAINAGGPRSGLDQMLHWLVAQIDARIDHAEQKRAVRGGGDCPDTQTLLWRGRWHLNRLTRTDSARAHALFTEALRREPDYPEAIIQMAFCVGWEVWSRRGSTAQVGELRRLSQRAILADPEDGRGHMLAGIAEMWLCNTHTARAFLETAIRLNPSLTWAYAQLGSVLLLSGKAADAIAPLQTALRLSPNDIHVFFPLGELAMAYALLGRWRESVEHADLALMRRPAYGHAHIAKITALFRSGQLPAAKQAAAALLKLRPNFSPNDLRWLPFTDRSRVEPLIKEIAFLTRTADRYAVH